MVSRKAKRLFAFYELSVCQLKEFIREPASLVWAVVFPLAMLTILGTIHQGDEMEEGKRYINFLVPGIICLVLMNSCLWGISYKMVEKRMKKNLKRMIAAPLNRMTFVLSFFITRLIINVAESLIIFVYSYLVFDISIEGNLFAMMLFYLSGHCTFMALAFLLSSRTSNTYTANHLINLIVLPNIFFANIFFNVKNFPTWLETVLNYLPATLLVDGFRVSFQQSISMVMLFIPCLILLLMSLIFIIISMRIFKWY